jgi:D-alanyl-D-alanine endopeptidase (penicillin-binding protein 7)
MNSRKIVKIGLFFVLVGLLAFAVRSARPEGTTETQASARATLNAAVDPSAVSAFDAPLLEDELPPGLSVDAKVAFVRELGAADATLAYHTKIFWPIASITKLMTAVVAEETLGENAKITITDTALAVEGVAGDLRAGERYTSWDLIKAMLTVSSNDAAEALAQAYDKTVLTPEEFNSALSKHAYFVAKMNEKARDLDMPDTSFGDPSGLSMTNQSTAGDLYKLVMYISQRYPDLWKITRNKTNAIADIIKGRRQALTSINAFSATTDFIGGKTGHTDFSGDNLISIFNYQGKQYMFLVFGAEDRFAETRKLVDWLKQHLAQY